MSDQEVTTNEAPAVPAPAKDDPILGLPLEDQDHVRQWKQARINVNMIEINGVYYYFRSFTRLEWQVMLDEQDTKAQSGSYTASRLSNELEEAVVLRCLLKPQVDKQTLKAHPAGVISSLSDSIMMATGFNQASAPVKL